MYAFIFRNCYCITYLSVVSVSLQAPRPSPGPHKLRECLPLVVMLRNRLKYALTGDEVKRIVKQRLIKIDGKVRTDPTFPAGFMGTLVLLLVVDDVGGAMMSLF